MSVWAYIVGEQIMQDMKLLVWYKVQGRGQLPQSPTIGATACVVRLDACVDACVRGVREKGRGGGGGRTDYVKS